MKKIILALIIVSLCVGLASCSSCSKQEPVNLDDTYFESPDQTTKPSPTSDDVSITSSGYTSDPDYTPTVDSRGEYKTIDGRANQVQYQGSKEQKSDLDAIDAYMKNNPNF